MQPPPSKAEPETLDEANSSEEKGSPSEHRTDRQAEVICDLVI